MKYVCDLCGWEYDEEKGYAEVGIAPDTAWEDVPEDFECPMCLVGKDQFSEAYQVDSFKIRKLAQDSAVLCESFLCHYFRSNVS